MVALTSPLVALAVLSAVAGLTLAGVVWRQRDASGAVAYTALMLVLATWSALYAVQLSQPTVAGKQPWLVIRHAIAPAIPITFWVFVARYTDRGRLLSARYLGPIVGVGLVLAPLPLLDPGNLYLADLAIAPVGPLPVLEIAFGPLFWLMLSYIVLVVGIGHGLVVGMLVDSFAVYRRQLAAVAVSGAVGFGLLALYLTEHVPVVPPLNPLPNVQLISYATVLVLFPLGWSYYRDALFSVQPLANQTVIGNMDDAVFVLDTDGVVRKANAPAGRLVGRSDEDHVAGSTVDAVFADRPALLEAYQHRVEDGQSPGGSGTVELTVGGTTRYYDVRHSPIHNASGDPIGRVLVLRDVSERARQRAQLERKNEQLERLADVVAHDVRAPLSTAGKLTTLIERDLEDADVDAEVEASLDDLETVHERLREFADHLPRLARESTDVESPVDCDLATVAERAWEVVETDDLVLGVESTTTLHGDPRRLERAFQNLFENVVTHATVGVGIERDGHARHGSQLVTDTEAATTVRVGTTADGVFVADDGPGIPPERRDDIFEYGVGSGDGSGFGLAIVRTIVEAHGWAIDLAESESGGARFEVRTVQ